MSLSTASTFSTSKRCKTQLTNFPTVEAQWSPWSASPVALVGSFDGEYQAVVAVGSNGQELSRLALPNGMSSLALHTHLTRKELCLSPRRGVLQFYTGGMGE